MVSIRALKYSYSSTVPFNGVINVERRCRNFLHRHHTRMSASKGFKAPKRLLEGVEVDVRPVFFNFLHHMVTLLSLQGFPATVYTLRIRTGSQKGSKISEPYSGLHVCLIGADGSSILRRIASMQTSASIAAELEEVCTLVDSNSGANCDAALTALKQKKISPNVIKYRFEEGSIDEVSFAAPEVGPLAGILIGPEQGSWYCDEVDVSSSRSGHTDRFICRELLGVEKNPAAYLKPIPANAVVYGSGEGAMILTRDQASRLHTVNMQEYEKLKSKLLLTTATLASGGSAGVLAFGGTELAVPFAMGGLAGVVYQIILQKNVDKVGAGLAYQPADQATTMKNPAILVAAFAAVATTVGVLLLHQTEIGQSMKPHSVDPTIQGQFQLKQAVALLAGFVMNKIAVLIAAAAPKEDSLTPSGSTHPSSRDQDDSSVPNNSLGE